MSNQNTGDIAGLPADHMKSVFFEHTKTRVKKVDSQCADNLALQMTTGAQAIQCLVEAQEMSAGGDSLMTVAEEVRYEEFNAVARGHMRSFYELGCVLRVIHQERLYRKQYRSFAEYCKQELGFGRSHGYRLMDAAEVVEEVSPTGDTSSIKNVHQALALKKGKLPEQQRDTTPANYHEQDAGEAEIVELENAAPKRA